MLPRDRFLAFIRDHRLFKATDEILLAVSGGRDSMLMTQLFNDAGLRFGIAHCNFGLRGAESDADEAFVRDIARRMNVPFFHVRFETEQYAVEKGISIQMAARELRYSWLETTRGDFGYSKVAIAHHLGDSTETVLLNLLRGTGLHGLHGIPSARENLVRPLLFLDREEMEALTTDLSLQFREDSSNASEKYTRNALRIRVIPELKKLNPGLDRTFSDNAERFAQAEELLRIETEKARGALFHQKSGDIVIPLPGLLKLQPLSLFLYELFSPFGFSKTAISDLESCLCKHPGKSFYSQHHRLTTHRNELILSKRSPEPVAVSVHATDNLVRWGDTLYRQREGKFNEFSKDPGKAFLPAEKLVYPLTIRSWRRGDLFRPFGMRGRKKISDLFVSLDIPLHLKSRIAVFENGNGDIIWLAGYRLSDDYKIGPQTKKVIIFEPHEQSGHASDSFY